MLSDATIGNFKEGLRGDPPPEDEQCRQGHASRGPDGGGVGILQGEQKPDSCRCIIKKGNHSDQAQRAQPCPRLWLAGDFSAIALGLHVPTGSR